VRDEDAVWRSVAVSTPIRNRESKTRNQEDGGREIRGRVPNGVVVPQAELPLPEGTVVTASRDAAPAPQPAARKRVELPLVHSTHPAACN
jgi:hypothetical protein